jgi:hypothetical protein
MASEANDEAPNTNVPKVGGRKEGLTKNLAKENEKKRKELVTNCAKLFHEEKVKAKKNGTVPPNGILKKYINEESKKSGLSNVSISEETIRS